MRETRGIETSEEGEPAMDTPVVKGSGIVYRNPKAFLRSVHAYFPSVVEVGPGQLLAAVVLGEAFESVDSRVVLVRSEDNGATWREQGRLRALRPGWSESCRLSRLSDGQIIALFPEYDRKDPEMGYTNPANMGFVPTRFLLYRSGDGGKTWTGGEAIAPPIEGPEFELCCPIAELSDGRLMLPTSTWRGWDGRCPNGMKAVALVSDDKGKSWPRYVDVMDGTSEQVIYWESKIVEMADGRLVAMAWTYDEGKGVDRNNSCAVSTDGGRSFGRPQLTDLQGQTPALLYLGGNRVFCAYRRMDKPGLWGATGEIGADGRWRTVRQDCLWNPLAGGVGGKQAETMVEAFHALKLGAPHFVELSNGEVLLTFWCVEDCVSNIRWVRLGQA